MSVLFSWRDAVVCSGAFFAIATEALIGLLLPLLALHQQLSPTELGLLVAAGSIGPILFALPGGALCDYFGDRKMMTASAIGVLASTIGYTQFSQFSALFMVALVGGLFRGVSWVATQSYALGYVSADRRQKFMGQFSFVAGMGMLVTPLIAGWLVEHVHLHSGFYFMAFWGGMVALVAALLPEIPKSTVSEPGGNGRKPIGTVLVAGYRDALPLLARPAIVLIMAFTLLRLAAAAINSSFYPVHLDQVGIKVVVIGQLFALIHVGTSAGTLISAQLGRLLSTGSVLGFSVALSLVSIAAVPFFDSLLPIAVLTLLHGVGQGISLPQILAALGRHSDASERGLVLGMRSMFNRTGYLVVPVMLGLMAEQAGLKTAFVVVGGLLLALVIPATVALVTLDSADHN
ncbi:MAG TPA: hypothetical protein DCF45_01515 [Gammaproteobacteria bacterium]|nr:hypothetical protein [Gammaproteobacteria bacterium]